MRKVLCLCSKHVEMIFHLARIERGVTLNGVVSCQALQTADKMTHAMDNAREGPSNSNSTKSRSTTNKTTEATDSATMEATNKTRDSMDHAGKILPTSSM